MIFFFKQKSAYEIRISDWSSDVCSSDLQNRHHGTALHLDLDPIGDFDADKMLAQLVDAAGNATGGDHFIALAELGNQLAVLLGTLHLRPDQEEPEHGEEQIGRASCRERVCQYV